MTDDARLDELFAKLAKHEADIASNRKAIEDWRKWITIRWLRNTMLWFAMPFGVLWGLGVEPVTAARFAVAPGLLWGATAALLGALMVAMQAITSEMLKRKIEAVHVAADALRAVRRAS